MEITTFKERIATVTQRMLLEHHEDFQRRELRPEFLGLVEDAPGSVELTIYFWQGKDLVDALEFHVVRDGQPAETEEALVEWLTRQLDDVLRRANR